MKKRAISSILSLALVLGMMTAVPAQAAAERTLELPALEEPMNTYLWDPYGGATAAAVRLYYLGLFKGVGTNADGSVNFDLYRTPTRAEGITILVRLLGKEAEAQAGTWTTPFTDVASWAKPYVGYAYTNGLTKGTSATTFGGEVELDTTQFLTLVLRAMGYQDGVDFQWNSAWTLSDKLGFTDHITNSAYYQEHLDRGLASTYSYQALGAPCKDGTLLYRKLMDAGVFTAETAVRYNLFPKEAAFYLKPEVTMDLRDRDGGVIVAQMGQDHVCWDIQWTVSGDDIFEVEEVTNSGFGAIYLSILPTAKGTATVTATLPHGVSKSCTVTVTGSASTPVTPPSKEWDEPEESGGTESGADDTEDAGTGSIFVKDNGYKRIDFGDTFQKSFDVYLEVRTDGRELPISLDDYGAELAIWLNEDVVNDPGETSWDVNTLHPNAEIVWTVADESIAQVTRVDFDGNGAYYRSWCMLTVYQTGETTVTATSTYTGESVTIPLIVDDGGPTFSVGVSKK